MSLVDYGWDDAWQEHFVEVSGASAPAHGVERIPARVVEEHRGMYRVRAGIGELSARAPGRLRHEARGPADFPAVGDWVVIEVRAGQDDTRIHAVLPRRTRFSRKTSGARTREQVVAANVDLVWITSSFGPDLNPARIDRYLTAVWDSGAAPVVVLTKADLAEAPEPTAEELRERLAGVPVHVVSAVDGTGLDSLRCYLAPGKTIALLGSSGVGKSTLLNRLAGREVMKTGAIRESDGKGRHKTTHRQLVLLPSGALLLDSPGMREIQLWSVDDGIERSFEDIESLAPGCRFSDCRHEAEPGCAVLAAVKVGEISPERLAGFHKLVREASYLERKLDVRACIDEKRRWKSITKDYRRNFKRND